MVVSHVSCAVVSHGGRVGSKFLEVVGVVGVLVLPILRLEFITGRGGAGFHSPGPALTMGRGGYFGGDPRPAPIRGKSPLLP